MKKFFKVLFKILKWLFLALAAAIVLFLIVRFVGQKIYNRTPKGGINEEMYVDINGAKQWINIYGQDKDNSVLFNPYYSLGDFYNYINSDYSVYIEFLRSDEFNKFSLLGKTDYQVPFYNINGGKDYQTNYLIAQDYFESVNAPRKKMYIMEDTTHGLLESKSEEFSDILHEIAQTGCSLSNYHSQPARCCHVNQKLRRKLEAHRLQAECGI